MKVDNFKSFDALDAAVDQTGAAFTFEHMYGFSAVTIMTGASTGSLKFQVSNDNVTWVDLANSTQALAAATSYAQNFDGVHFKWCRPVYTHTNGLVGTITVVVNCKGS